MLRLILSTDGLCMKPIVVSAVLRMHIAIWRVRTDSIDSELERVTEGVDIANDIDNRADIGGVAEHALHLELNKHVGVGGVGIFGGKAHKARNNAAAVVHCDQLYGAPEGKLTDRLSRC